MGMKSDAKKIPARIEAQTYTLVKEKALSENYQDNLETDGCQHGDSWRRIPIELQMSIGRKCMRIIDEARLHGPHIRGHAAEVVEFIKSIISPENWLIIMLPGHGQRDHKQEHQLVTCFLGLISLSLCNLLISC